MFITEIEYLLNEADEIVNCPRRKCKNPSCSVQIPTCQMIDGYCPECYQKQKQNAFSSTYNFRELIK